MEQLKQVVWKEGIFISPQHFQQQALHFKSYIHNYASAMGYTQHYGVSSLTINTDLLKIGKIAISTCNGLFPDGYYFHLDQEIVLNVPDDTVNQTVFLLLPLALQGGAAYGQESDLVTRFVCQTVTSYNNASTESDSLEIEVARDNIVLSLGKTDLTGFVSFPIARVLEKRETGEVIFDNSFIPSCIHYQASFYLTDKINMLQSLMQNRAEEVHKRISIGQESKSEQTFYKDYLWLQTLNRWLAWANWLQQDKQFPTYQLYRDLTELSGDLAGLTPELPQAFKLLQYDQLYQVFNPIFMKLRQQLSLVLQDTVVEFKWDSKLFDKRRLLRCMINNPDSMLNRRFVMCIESSLSAEKLAQVIPQAVTMAGTGHIVELVRNAMSGVELTYLAVAPNELKFKSTATYFEVNTQHEIWQDMLNKGEILNMHIDIRVPDLDVTLFAL